jgi:hypothetical protein
VSFRIAVAIAFEEAFMPEQQPNPSSSKDSVSPHENVAGAHTLLQSLQERIGYHPELAEAITKLEMALNSLTLNTGGML